MPEQLSDKVIALCGAAKKLADEVLVPSADAPRAKARAAVIAASKAAGLFQLTQPAQYGGSAADQLTLCAVRDALAYCNAPNSHWVFGPGPGVLAGAEGELRERYLGPLLAGEISGGFGLTEPDDAPFYTRAVADGERLIVDGQKSYVTGGDTADFINTLVRIDEVPVLLLIDTNAPGVRKTAVFNSIDGSNHAAYAFEQVAVPNTHMIGKPGEGMPRALGQIGDTRLAIAANCVGHMRWVYDYVSTYLGTPDRSGKPRGNAPVARLRLGEMFTAAYAARSMLYRTARLADSGRNAVNEAMATKVHATNALTTVIDEAIQIVGGSAVVDNHPLAALYKSVRSLHLTEGATDTLYQNIARGTLDLNKGAI